MCGVEARPWAAPRSLHSHQVYFSDHYPLSLNLMAPSDESKVSEKVLPLSYTKNRGLIRKWATVNPDLVLEEIIKRNLEQVLECLDTKLNIPVMIKSYKAINETIKELFIKSQREGKQKNKGWFNRECSHSHN